MGSFGLFARPMEGSPFWMDVYPRNTVWELKAEIRRVHISSMAHSPEQFVGRRGCRLLGGIPRVLQELRFRGEVLQNRHTLEQRDITNGSTIRLDWNSAALEARTLDELFAL